MAKSAEHPDSEIPPLVLRYCSRDVKATLAVEKSIFNGGNWTLAKEHLLYYYSPKDKDARSPEGLCRFASKSRHFKNQREFDEFF